MIRVRVLDFCDPPSKWRPFFTNIVADRSCFAPPRMPMDVRPGLTIYNSNVHLFEKRNISCDTVSLNVV